MRTMRGGFILYLRGPHYIMIACWETQEFVLSNAARPAGVPIEISPY